jgi:hypothetical protein
MASIGGLFLSLQNQYAGLHNVSGDFLFGLFGVTLLLCGYILFVPGSAWERNVTSKMWPSFAVYTDATKPGQQVEIQRGEFRAAGTQSLDIQFNRPFAAAPSVEVVDVYHKGDAPKVNRWNGAVTAAHASVSRASYQSDKNERAYYVWIATGVPLHRIDNLKPYT